MTLAKSWQFIGSTEGLAYRLYDALRKGVNARLVQFLSSQLPDGRGLGELTTFGPNQVAEVHNGMIQSSQIDPETLGMSFGMARSVTVESPAESAAMVRRVLAGESGPARDIVCLNTAAALMVADVAEDWSEGLDRATEAIDSGAAREALDKLVAVTNR